MTDEEIQTQSSYTTSKEGPIWEELENKQTETIRFP